jgi:hypothetical protein
MIRSHRLQLLALLLLLIPFGLYLSISIYNRLAADDFCHVVATHQLGILGNVANEYQTWTGQWSYALFTSLTKILPMWATPFFILLLWLLVFVMFARQWIILIGLTLILATLTMAPNVFQSVYWEAATLKNSFFLVLLCFELWLVFYLPETPLTFGILALYAIFTAGMSDLGGIVQVIAVVVVLLIFPERYRSLYACLVGAVAGFLIVALAPGTEVRRTFFPPSNIIQSVIDGVHVAGYPIAMAIKQSPLAMAALIVIALFQGQQTHLSHPEKRAIRLKMIVLLVSVLFLNTISEIAAYYTTSRPIADRTQIIPLFLSLTAIAVISYWAGALWNQKSQVAVVIGAGVLATVCLFSALELRSTMADFAQAWDQRDQSVRAGGTLTHLDILGETWDTEDPGIRSCIVTYYQITTQ